MGNLAITYRYIADILSYKTPNSNLEKDLSQPSFNWDTIVIEGSKHLVLPAIYCRLKAKNLLHLLPEELRLYLKEITTINRNRNNGILNQVNSISKLLNENQINYVFLKGTAQLIHGCFSDIGERMIGDIDILVCKKQLQQSFELLKSNGYNKTFGYAYNTIDFRHLDRLVSDNELAAIELHGELLNNPNRYLLKVNNVLSSKVYKNKIAIPNTYFLSLHQILGWQINNMGYYYRNVSFKSFYDSIVLGVYDNETLIADLLKNKYGETYLELAKCYFIEFESVFSNKKMKSYRLSHQRFVKNPFFKSFVKPLKYAYSYTLKRLNLFVNNKFYRTHLLKKIFISKK